MGGFQVRNKETLAERMESVYDMFPILKGTPQTASPEPSPVGEQQMLAIGRGMVAAPKLIMFDEPSLGLAPMLVQSIFELVVRINKELGDYRATG